MNHAASNPSITSRQSGLAGFLFSLGLLFLSGCSVQGPPFPPAPAGAPGPSAGRFRFTPPVRPFPRAFLGQVEIERLQDSSATEFTMTMVGRLQNGSYRVRRYEGRAILTGKGGMELRAIRCYNLGKKEIEDKLVPLERWDCDHLIFAFRSDPSGSGSWLYDSTENSRTRATKWIGPFDLVPLVPASWREKAVFAGQVMETLPGGEIVVWGPGGASILRDGQRLQVADARGDAGEAKGSLRVISRPGDFIITRMESGEPPLPESAVFATEYGKKGGLW